MTIIDEWLTDRAQTHWNGCEESHIKCAVAAELDRLRALVEKREKQIVWCVKNGSDWVYRNGGGSVRFGDPYGDGFDLFPCDGTDAGILAAVDQAMGER